MLRAEVFFVKVIVARVALVLVPLLVVGCATTEPAPTPTPTPAPDPAVEAAALREQQEARFVEIIRTTMHATPKDPVEREALSKEMFTLLLALTGIDPENPPPDADVRVSQTMGEVLNRRDPVLAKAFLQNMERFQCRSRQAEAKLVLRTVGVFQRMFHEEHKRHAKTLEELGPAALPEGPPRHYDITLSVDKQHVTATAKGKDVMAGDVWMAVDSGAPENVSDLCPPAPATPPG